MNGKNAFAFESDLWSVWACFVRTPLQFHSLLEKHQIAPQISILTATKDKTTGGPVLNFPARQFLIPILQKAVFYGYQLNKHKMSPYVFCTFFS